MTPVHQANLNAKSIMSLNLIIDEASAGYASPDKLRQMIRNKMSRNPSKQGALQSALNKVQGGILS